MAIGNFLKSFLGVSESPKEKVLTSIDYEEFKIEADPINDDGKFRVAGFISGEKDGEMLRIQFIRADQISDEQMAIDQSLKKARQIIDEQGKNLLNKSHL